MAAERPEKADALLLILLDVARQWQSLLTNNGCCTVGNGVQCIEGVEEVEEVGVLIAD